MIMSVEKGACSLVVYLHPWGKGTGEAHRQLQALKALAGKQSRTPEWVHLHVCKPVGGFLGQCPTDQVREIHEAPRQDAFGAKRPFVHDLMDMACEHVAGPQTWAGFMQSDILLRSEFWDQLGKLSSDFEMVVGHRRDLGAAQVSETYSGIDLVLFRAEIWPMVKPYYPDLILTDSWWDMCMLGLADRMKLKCKHLRNSELLHFAHLPSGDEKTDTYNAELVQGFDKGRGLG